MTEPDPHGFSEDFGTIEIFGIPFSTFTRSIVMGLEEFGLGNCFIQHHTPPHSGEVRQRNPFGLLPVLVHRPNAIYSSSDDTVILYESNAIRRYIDESLGLQANQKFKHKVELTPPAAKSTPMERARVDQWVSVAATVIFPAVELGVVKRRLAMEGNSADDESITLALDTGLEKLHDRLAIVEQMFNQPFSGDYICGNNVSWADLFAYPPLADLRAIKEGEPILRSGKDALYPKLNAWMDRMEQRESAKKTYPGTLASQRKKN
ncbi:glutathione S-transferase [Meira miltonrushii]|uniref:Glutathione S-transferase n=1 Tax=Meira miltonrushii TaxID=1280837 RepID=A0A316V1L3_9BASI|nr:glutathione S-transferase [Meira miltonrushii]PWN31440.1 glutathione S-transferase [Meira miltonrushii]